MAASNRKMNGLREAFMQAACILERDEFRDALLRFAFAEDRGKEPLSGYIPFSGSIY